MNDIKRGKEGRGNMIRRKKKNNRVLTTIKTGTPVHICSGATASALSIYLSYPQFRSKRSKTRTPSHIALHRPGNSYSQMIAMIIIWVRTCTVVCRKKTRLSIHTQKRKEKKNHSTSPQTYLHPHTLLTNLPSRAPGSPSTPEQPSA